MPWHIVKSGAKFNVVKDTDGSVAGSHDTEAEAKKQLAALYANEPAMHSERIAFDDFADRPTIQGPIRLLPEGVWHRGGRKLTITRERLEEMARNFLSGLPRFRVGINLDHKDDAGKVGNVKAVAYLPEGDRGPGLYATEFELTPKGEKAIGEDGYDGVSAEVVWTLNDGARYQDPETGSEHDNVLVGLALTPTPFFGHQHVALFSAKEATVDTSILENLRAGLRELLGLKGKELAPAPEPPPDPIPAEEAEVSMEKEEFEAKIKASTDALAAEKARADKLEADIAAEKLAARKVVLKTEAESFKALAIEPDKYAEGMAELEGLKPEIADWMRKLLAGADAAAKAVMVEAGTSQTTDGAPLAELAKGLVVSEKLSYSDALAKASKLHPELA